MASHIENLLKTTLSQDPDYSTTQMIKSGQLCEAAAKVLNKRRKLLNWQRFTFFAIICVPIVGNLIMAVSSNFNGSTGTIIGLEMFPFIALGLLAGIVEVKASITRLETVLTIWLLENTELQNETAEPLVKSLHQ